MSRHRFWNAGEGTICRHPRSSSSSAGTSVSATKRPPKGPNQPGRDCTRIRVSLVVAFSGMRGFTLLAVVTYVVVGGSLLGCPARRDLGDAPPAPTTTGSIGGGT